MRVNALKDSSFILRTEGSFGSKGTDSVRRVIERTDLRKLRYSRIFKLVSRDCKGVGSVGWSLVFGEVEGPVSPGWMTESPRFGYFDRRSGITTPNAIGLFLTANWKVTATSITRQGTFNFYRRRIQYDKGIAVAMRTSCGSDVIGNRRDDASSSTTTGRVNTSIASLTDRTRARRGLAHRFRRYMHRRW